MVSETYSVHIDAAPEKIWAVMTDVENWPEWNQAMARVQRLDNGEFAEGSRAKIKLKGAPASVWTVGDLAPGKSFTWGTKARGLESTAEHILEPDGDATKVTLGIVHRGVMAAVLALILRSVSRRNLRMEGEGLKARCEAG